MDELLKGNEYELIVHDEPIKTIQNGINVLRIESGQAAAAIILKSENKLLLFIVSGKRGKLDLAKLSEQLNLPSLTFASKKEIENLLNYKIGAIPLVIPEIPCYTDSLLFQYEFIYGGTGIPTQTLKISPKVLEEINNVVLQF